MHCAWRQRIIVHTHSHTHILYAVDGWGISNNFYVYHITGFACQRWVTFNLPSSIWKVASRFSLVVAAAPVAPHQQQEQHTHTHAVLFNMVLLNSFFVYYTRVHSAAMCCCCCYTIQRIYDGRLLAEMQHK